MPKAGSPPSLPKRSARLVLAVLILGGAGPPGDAARGRAIVASRQAGLCLLCHAGPFPDPHLQGSIAPDLAGVGSRLSPDEIRQRLVDPAQANPDTIMPSYSRTNVTRPGRQWAGKPILTDQQIEDVVAYLATLKDP